MYAANVQGTRDLLAAAAEAGVERLVYTSTVGALGNPGDGTPGTEETPVALADMAGHYKRSKFLAEQVALEFARQGLPVVLVHPSAPVGPGDSRPTPTGQIIVDYPQGPHAGLSRDRAQPGARPGRGRRAPVGRGKRPGG